MRKLAVLICLAAALVLPVAAMDYTAPEAPQEAQELMPVETGSFGSDLWKVIRSAVGKLQPEIAEAAGICLSLICLVMLISLLKTMPGKAQKVVELVGVLAVAVLLLQRTNAMIRLGADTVTELSEYGKLLLPVMTAALASQGGLTASASLYTGTAVFDAVLCAGISGLLLPLVYVFLALSAAGCATGVEAVNKLRDFVRWLTLWILKWILYIFTGYIGITGVVSGTADAATVKAAKLTMAGMIPVVGGILADASEAVIVGAGVMKSAVGVYGLLAVIAIWISPFLKIGIQYLLLKLTAAACETFGVRPVSALIGAFSEAMGMLLGMTSAVCVLLLISMVCFMKGVG
ncbi:MAG: hypothetical protein PUB93_04305 [Firmicutes bacterium]|nr:hypothetical protein [Bacillota bacterium]